VKVLSVKALSEKLDERFRLLTGGDRTALPRQQTMRALVDWSYDLLSNNERALFRRLSIFAGGFKLETAVAVCADEVVADFEVLDLLSSLVDKSLVHAELAGDDTRYRLLESTRQYAREKLVERGERDPVAARHATAFMKLAERLNAEWATTPDRTWLAEVEPELDNWRAALNWALVERGDVPVGQWLAANLFWVWHATAPAEGRRWVRNALELADDATPLATLAELQIAETQLNMAMSLWGAGVVASETALATCERLGEPFLLARAQRQVGASLTFTGRHEEGERVLRRALETFRELGVRREVGITLRLLGAARDFAGDFESSRALHAESLTVFKALGADRQIAMTANNLAEVEFHAGNVEAAIRLISESLVQNRAGGGPRALAIDLANSAAYLWFVGRFDEARAQARECLSLARLHQLEITVAFVLQHLAAIALGAVAGEDAERRRETALRAAQLLGFVEERIAQLEAAREYTEEVELEAMLGQMRALLGPEVFEAAQQRGRSLTEDQAVSEALAL
jgi:predicted ATPase